MNEPCEICGTIVRTMFAPSPTLVVLCTGCIEESRKIDGTLASAFEKVIAKRNERRNKSRT